MLRIDDRLRWGDTNYYTTYSTDHYLYASLYLSSRLLHKTPSLGYIYLSTTTPYFLYKHNLLNILPCQDTGWMRVHRSITECRCISLTDGRSSSIGVGMEDTRGGGSPLYVYKRKLTKNFTVHGILSCVCSRIEPSLYHLRLDVWVVGKAVILCTGTIQIIMLLTILLTR